MKKLITLSFVLLVFSGIAQNDNAVYKEKQNGFYQKSIIPGIENFEESKTTKENQTYLSLDLDNSKFPTNPEKYKRQWHNSPLSQGNTGTCWCFAGISFLETEIYRMSGQEIKLSEMYIVYWEYVRRAEYFVNHRGNMYFGQGSETNAVLEIMEKRGLVPLGQYSGMLKDQEFHNHSKLSKEIKTYLDFVKQNNLWDQAAVASNVKSILNHYMGEPPATVRYKDKKYTPVEFMNQVTKLNPNDYYCFMSTLSKTFNQKGELEEPDNWWHNDDYYNLHLEEFNSLLQSSMEAGYTVSICGDVSEPGYDRYAEVGIVPDFDIPSEYITQSAREFRINNKSTTDDHCIHLVGFNKDNGDFWFMIKDSSSSGFDGPNKGYRFINEDYVKLKILTLMMHKDAARPVLDKIIK